MFDDASAEKTNDAVIFKAKNGDKTDWSGDRVTIVYVVDNDYFTTKSRRQQTISISVSSAKTDTNKAISIMFK